jgi:hypothetical protein
LLAAALCVALLLAANFGYHSYQRQRVESARQVLLSPLSDYSQTKQAIDEIANSGSAGRYAIPELLRHGKPGPYNDFWKEKLDIFRKLGPDAAPAIPDLLLCLNDGENREVRTTLDAIDPNWRDRPEVPIAVYQYLNRACTFSHLDPREPQAPSEEQMKAHPSLKRLSAAVALHRLVGDDVARARRIIDRAGPIDRYSPNTQGRLRDNADSLIPHLVEHYKGPYPPEYHATVRFLLEVLDPNWDQSEAAKKAYPYLVKHLIGWEISIDDPLWIDARDWVVKRVPADVILDGCLTPTQLFSSGLSDTAVDLVCQYPQPVRQRLVSACLQHGRWLNPKLLGRSLWHEWSRDQELRNLSRLDPNWHQNRFAVNAIPALMQRAVCVSEPENKEDYELLDKIDPKWFQHPHAKLMVPFLVEQVSPTSPRMTELLRDHAVQEVNMWVLDPLDRAADMLTRLGPNAREAIPKLLVIRAKGIAPEYRSQLHWRPRDRIESLLAKFPDVIDANWPDAVESLAAIPELIALLDKKPATALENFGQLGPAASSAELLGRFGPVARSALPTLKKTLRETSNLNPEEIKAIELAITRITPQARSSEQK